MNDRAVKLLEKYEVEIFRTRKGRGVILCDTDKGTLCFQEYNGQSGRLLLMDRLTKRACENGLSVQTLLRTKEGEPSVQDTDGCTYLLKTYPTGRECDVREKEELKEAVRVLARLHQAMTLPEEEADDALHPFSVTGEYEKRNRELTRIRKFLRKKGQKNAFEAALLKNIDPQLEKAGEALENWKKYEKDLKIESGGNFCHGDFQYHHLIYEERDLQVINFEHIVKDRQIHDLYYFLRKILEKNDWSASLGQELLGVYEKEKPIDHPSMIDLYYRFSYPEKFWKIANFYMNAPKSWIPMKNLEKLELTLEQEAKKEAFIRDLLITG